MPKMNDEKSLLQKLVRNFYDKTMAFSLTTDEVQHLTLDLQDKFLYQTISSVRLKQYPPNVEFTKLFFKKLIALLEGQQEVHEDFYSTLCAIIQNGGKSNWYFSHYLIDDDINTVVTIKETNNMVMNGTTGMKTWEAAIMLSDWALCNKEIFARNNILELGSGVGLTGITIAKLCEIKSIYLTDCHPLVIDTLNENVQINFPNIKRDSGNTSILYRKSDAEIGVTSLDWNNIEEFNEEIIPDIIIGADIVYDPTITQALCNVFSHFINKNSNLQIFIQSVIRNQDTFDGFLDNLRTRTFKVEKLTQEEPVHFKWDTSTQRCLLRITH